MKQYQLAIFDLDGTLIDSSEGITHAVIDTLKILGYDQLPVELIKQCIGPPIGDSIGSVVGYSQKQIDEFYKVFRPTYKEKYLMECTVYPGIIRLISTLRDNKIKTAIATNKRIDYTMDLLDNLKLLPLFDCIEAMDMGGHSKKYQLIQRCIQKLKVKQNEAVMIGDSPNDHDAAISAGIDFIGVCYGFGFTKNTKISCPMANNMEELFDFIMHD